MERNKKKKKAISVVLIGHKVRDVVRIFCVVGNHQSLHELFLDDQLENNQGQRDKFGHVYFHFAVKQEGTVNWTHNFLPEAIEPSIGYAVLLPLFAKKSPNYYFLDSLLVECCGRHLMSVVSRRLPRNQPISSSVISFF